MAQFFIDRPIFAWVIALFILVMGGVAVTQLPVAQYPTVAPPSIVISAGSPGASDDAAGVAAALEIVRAIQAGGQPLRDIIVLITDGEEAGLRGAPSLADRDRSAGYGTPA